MTKARNSFKREANMEHQVDPEHCKNCGFKNTPLCTHPDGVYQDEPAGLTKLIEEAYTCPDCHMVSFNPNDIKYSYCGNCHKFEGQ